MTNAMDRDELLELTERTSTRFQHGDPSGMLEFYAERDDVTLLGALGGCAVGREAVAGILRRASAALGKGGDAEYEVLAMHVDENLACMVGIERVNEAAEGVGTLRVTNVFKRIDGRWRLVHRHADALKQSPFGSA